MIKRALLRAVRMTLKVLKENLSALRYSENALRMTKQQQIVNFKNSKYYVKVF
jgi:hypothetical protein